MKEKQQLIDFENKSRNSKQQPSPGNPEKEQCRRFKPTLVSILRTRVYSNVFGGFDDRHSGHNLERISEIIGQLEQLVAISEMIKALYDLNQGIQNTESEQGKLMAFFNSVEKLNMPFNANKDMLNIHITHHASL
ncbi:hypothetical protein JTB14_007798 [Gonioctena quinquepunctata]|nr:hypothetical protein JTB14_007798 [Gonioctena quinquepunctata]